MAAGIQAQLHYSREDERQADQLGLKFMELGGLDASGLVSTLKKLEKGNWLGSDQIPYSGWTSSTVDQLRLSPLLRGSLMPCLCIR